MESIKSILQTLAGEDITEDNLDRLSILAAALNSALQDHRKQVVMREAGVAVVLPEGFNTNLPQPETAPKALENLPVTSPVVAKNNSVGFAVPRPPSVVKVDEKVTPREESAPDKLPEIEANPGVAFEIAPLVTASVKAVEETTNAATLVDEQPEPEPIAYKAIHQHEAEPAPVAYNEPEDATAVEPMHFELALSEEMLAEISADEGKPARDEEIMTEEEEPDTNPEPLPWEAPITAPAPGHQPYLPASMRIAAIDDILVLPSRPAAPAAAKPAEQDGRELNERLQTRQRELAEVLQEPKLVDLKKGISINDRYQYVQNLFRGEEDMFDRSIKTLNTFNILPEAQYWMQRELVVKLGWNDEDELVQQFYGLVSRRFR